MTYNSIEACKSDNAKKSTVKLWAVCAEEEGAYNVTQTGCTTFIRATSKGACNVLNVGGYFNGILKKFHIYTGALVAIIGIALYIKGFWIWENLKKAVITLIIWIVLFGICYNVYPPFKLTGTVIAVMAGVTLVLAIIVGLLVAQFLADQVFNIVAGVVGAALFVFLVGLAKQDKNGKIVAIAGLVGFILGVVLASCNKAAKVTMESYALTFLGSYLFFYGVSCYLNGFQATSWSVYVYAVLIIVAGFVRGWASKDEAIKDHLAAQGNSNDAFGDQEESYKGVV